MMTLSFKRFLGLTILGSLLGIFLGAIFTMAGWAGVGVVISVLAGIFLFALAMCLIFD
jgi:hypothetical protein